MNDQLIELKGELEQKTLTITQLQETVKTLELAQSSHNQSTNYSELCECLQSELETAKDQIEELKSQWQVAEEQNYEMNGNLEMMRNQCAEYREILQVGNLIIRYFCYLKFCYTLFCISCSLRKIN